MASQHLDDAPPPYSETDVFSTSGRDAHGADDASRSTTSTNGDVIYTPPLTPRSSHHSNFAGELDALASSPAAAYFASRPAPPLASQPHIVHSIALNRHSTPDSLPFPRDLAARDVRLEDWQTFANYLMPHYSAASNEQVIDRKLRAEAMTATNTISSNNNNDDARSQSSGRSHAEAQLNRIRSPVDADATQQRQNVEATVREWNDGFFAPRRITISVDLEPTGNNPTATNHAAGLNEVPPDPEKQPIPGAWDQSFDNNNNTNPDTDRNNNNNDNQPPRRGFGSFFNPFASRGGGTHGSGGRGGGFRFGGINVEGDRVSIGNSFVADGRTGSLRIGGIVADGNGIRINGQPMFGTGHLGRGGPCGPPGWGGPRHGHGGPGAGWGGWGERGSWSRGGGWGSWGGGGGWAGRHGPGHHGPPPPPGEEGRGREEHRGHSGERHRSRSSSASSVTSRTSSVSSVSTVGSLPDYDDLRDAQLPIAKQHLQEWLQRPDQPITKERVKLLKEQIKAAKNSTPVTAAGFDKTALRREVKDLLRDWKQLKRQQKRDRKQLRREMKHRRRQEKRERRHAKREMKRAAREMRREWRRGPHPHPPHHHPHGPHPPHGPPPPPFPQGPGPFGIPPFPPMPHMPPFPGAWPGENHQQPPNTTRGANDEGVEACPEYTAAATASQAKYQAAWEMEARVAEKEAELLQLHERLAEEQQNHSGGSGERVTEKGTEKGASKVQAEAEAVEREIEELAREMERLRTEADEEFAKELAEEEERRVRG